MITIKEIVITKEPNPVSSKEIPEELQEVDHENIWDSDMMKSLSDKSKEALQKTLGNKPSKQIGRDLGNILRAVSEAESNFRPQLENLVVRIVSELFPIVEDQNWKIDVKIVDRDSSELNFSKDEPSTPLPSTPETALTRRRIINSITQGASVRGAYGFHLFKDALDQMNPDLADMYQQTLDHALGMYNNEETVAYILQQVANDKQSEGGSSDIEYNEEQDRFILKARGVNFPVLLHECIKALYEVVGTEGFGHDKERNKDIVKNVDKLENEPRDLQYGPMLYDALNNLFVDSGIDDSRVRDIFFTKVYKIPGQEFVQFMQNVYMEKLTPQQKKWVGETLQQIAQDLGTEDASTSVHGRPDIEI
jgi:hypothetical protein